MIEFDLVSLPRPIPYNLETRNENEYLEISVGLLSGHRTSIEASNAWHSFSSKRFYLLPYGEVCRGGKVCAQESQRAVKMGKVERRRRRRRSEHFLRL